MATTGERFPREPLAVDATAGGHASAGGGNGFDVGVQGTPVEDVDDALQAGGGLSVGGVLQGMPRE